MTKNVHSMWLVPLVALALALVVRAQNVSADPPVPSPAQVTTPPTAGGEAQAAPVAPQPDPNTATIIVATQPPSTATVLWGRKLVGKITPGKPLVLVRPRDSGPLDLTIKAAGFMTVQTRAFTFSDQRVVVKLTTLENARELLGYREPLDAGVPPPEQAAALDALGNALAPEGLPAPSPVVTPPAPPPFQVVPPQPQPTVPPALTP